MVCRGLMLKLPREGLIELPPVRYVPPNPLAERGQPGVVRVDTQLLQGTLAETQPLELREVRRTPDEALFNSLLAQFHYLGYRQPVGEQLKYLVFARGRSPAWPGLRPHATWGAAIASSAGPPRLDARTSACWPTTRAFSFCRESRCRIWLRTSCRMARVLAGDWERLYGHPIYFLETFVDPQRQPGTCYRATNWVRLGDTTGRGKDAPTSTPNRSIKEVLGYPLRADFRQRLSEP
jgi:hypothetical protein